MSAKAVRLKKPNYKITAQGWNLDSVENLADLLDGVIVNAIGEFLELAAKEPAQVYLAHQYSAGTKPCDGLGGKPVKNPLLLYIQVPLGDEDWEPAWAVDLSSIFADVIEGFEHGPGGHIDAEDAKVILKMRDALQKQVAMLTEALERPVKP